MSFDHTPEPDANNLQQAYEAIFSARMRGEIEAAECKARVTALYESPLAAGLSSQECDAIADKAVYVLTGISDDIIETAPSGTIDFRAAQQRRSMAEMDADEAYCSGFQDQLTQDMLKSGLTDAALTLTVLLALLDALEAGDDNNRADAVKLIARGLRMFDPNEGTS